MLCCAMLCNDEDEVGDDGDDDEDGNDDVDDDSDDDDDDVDAGDDVDGAVLLLFVDGACSPLASRRGGVAWKRHRPPLR